jgi:hypothetical protein
LAASALISRGTFMWSVRVGKEERSCQERHSTAIDGWADSPAVRIGAT